MIMNRRNMLASSAAAFTLAACGDKSVKPVMGSIPKVGLQTYTLREALKQDFTGTLQMIKDVGYDYVELNDRNFKDNTPEQLKAMLDDVGLPSPASHVGFDTVVGDTAAVVKTAKILGLEYVVVPYMAEDRRKLEDWNSHAKALQTAGRMLADNGIKLAYHNHQFEFDDLGGGTTAMDILLNDVDPSTMDFEMDLYWAALAKADVPTVFKAHPGRFKLCHIKDMTGDPWAAVAAGADYGTLTRDFMVNVGEGDIDFKPVFALNEISGMEYFIAEHDFPRTPYREAIATSLSAIKAMRF